MSAPTRFAEMTEPELYSAWLITNPSQGFAALRDAILAERDAEWDARLAGHDSVRAALRDDISTLRTRAERAEQERDEFNRQVGELLKRVDEARNWYIDALAKLRSAESALGEAQRKAFVDGVAWYRGLGFSKANHAPTEAAHRYPATPSGEGVRQTEPLVIPVEDTFGVPRITITASDARRLLALAQTTTETK